MARTHGRFSRLYVNNASGGTAAPLLHTATIELNMQTDKVDVTAHQDTTKQYVAGLPDAQGTFSGFWTDTASTALITAALDGVARKFYFYPGSSDVIYQAGTAFFDFGLATDVQGAVAISGSFALATPLINVGF